MAKANRTVLYFLLALIVSGLLTLHVVIAACYPGTWLVHEPLHSGLEAFGAMSALVMAIFLLQGKREKDIEKYSPLAAGFLGMGILDAFHAVSRPGDSFIFFHSMASLAGASGSALVWFPNLANAVIRKRRTAWIIAAGFLLVGLLVAQNAEMLPAMKHDGAFSSIAVTINFGSGMLFIAVAAFFLKDFYRFNRRESYLFACLYLLFGLSQLEFPFSAAWDANWWFWHVQRLTAYIVVLYFLFHVLHRIERIKERLIVQLQDALADVKQLSGMLPICASCKKIRDDGGYWKQIESYIIEHSEAEFSHGLCPDCAKKAYQELNAVNRK
jgi:succinate dehydrogenase/fumarate reductase cytochrome b subunit